MVVSEETPYYSERGETMTVNVGDGKVLLDEFNKNFPHGLIRAKRHIIISQIDNSIKNIPLAIMQILQRYTVGELIQWYYGEKGEW